MMARQRMGDRRRAAVLAALAVIVVLAAGSAVSSGLRAAALRSGDAGQNTALVDPVATSEVVDQIGASVKAVFSYDYANLARTERAAGETLVEKAAAQYQASFAAAGKQAEEQKLVRSTTIRAIGVRELRGDTARVLVFLDQQTLHSAENRQSSIAAHVDITAKKVDGRWKIAELTPL